MRSFFRDIPSLEEKNMRKISNLFSQVSNWNFNAVPIKPLGFYSFPEIFPNFILKPCMSP